MINVRAAEPDEAIASASGVSGESGLDEEYERVHIKFDKDLERKTRNEALPPISRRKSTKSRRFSKSPPRAYSPPAPGKSESSDEDIKSWEIVQKDDYDGEDNSAKRNLSASSSGSFVPRSSLRDRDSASNLRRRNRSTTREERAAHSKLRSSSLQPEHRDRQTCYSVFGIVQYGEYNTHTKLKPFTSGKFHRKLSGCCQQVNYFIQ